MGIISGLPFPQVDYALVALAGALRVREDLVHAGLRQEWVTAQKPGKKEKSVPGLLDSHSLLPRARRD